jgi:hypothetical protein
MFDMIEGNINQCYEKELSQLFKEIHEIRAVFLVSDIHPLLDEKTLEVLNLSIEKHIQQFSVTNNVRRVRFETLKYQIDSTVTFGK